MTKNTGKGGKSHKKMKNDIEIKRELIFKEDGQEYATIIDMLGSGRCNIKIIDSNVKCLGIIRGGMRKNKSKNFIRKDDIVLISLREYQEEKVDIIHLYTFDEVKSLIEYGEIKIENNTEDEFITFE